VIGSCDPTINGRTWRTMRKLAVKIATQSAPKLNPRSPVYTQSARIPRRTAGLLRLGCSNSSKGVENSPTRTECCAQTRALSTERMKSVDRLLDSLPFYSESRFVTLSRSILFRLIGRCASRLPEPVWCESESLQKRTLAQLQGPRSWGGVLIAARFPTGNLVIAFR